MVNHTIRKRKIAMKMKAMIGRCLLGVGLLALSSGVFAAQTPFTQAKFDQALKAGTPTIVYVRASWCPICHAQQPIVDRLSAEPEFQPVTILLADFDTEKALKKELKVNMQSTFVVFKQGHEVARSTGQTKESVIRATFEKSL
jgi:thioredoxin 1